jgi:acyl homoserine lactone synthase
MARVVVGRRCDLDPALYAALLRYRHRVFVRTLGWEVPGVSRNAAYEEDQFDSEECVYVIALSNGEVCGCARLLPTTRPYLLEQLFPTLFAGASLPRSERVWEMSRLAASPIRVQTAVTSDLGLQVFAAGLDAGRSLGATQIVGVVSKPVLRMCERNGITLERLSATMRVHGQLIVACAVELGERAAR